RQQAARAGRGRGAGEDRGPRLHHPVHPEAAAGAVCAAGPGGGRLMATMARRLLSLGATISRPQWPMPGSGLRALFPPRTWAIVLGAYLALALLVPILNLAVPVGSALHVS